jgi:ATP-binding cassette, subfamily F, member 3
MLRIEHLIYRIGPRILLDEADVAINPGHKVGLVGRNGTGKTTLLRLITGALEVDGGTIKIPARWRIGVTSQEAPGGTDTLLDTVLKADTERGALLAEAETATDPGRVADIHHRLQDLEAHTAPTRAARILAGLGFDDAAQKRPCNDFSGGWRMRVALAALLFSQPDLLLLDEPTNHLDLEATLWLEDYLRRYRGTVLIVSHDRDLLNRVVDEILHLEHSKLTLYQGGYDRFEKTRRMRLELNQKARAKQDVQRAHIQKFVDRFRYKANKAKQAQSRLKMLERMEPIPEEQSEGGIAFAFPDPKPLPPPLYSADNVVVGYDGKPVLTDVTIRLDSDDRIALLGANGNGKSTLVKLLAGRLAPMAGDVSKSGKLRIGYFAQHQTDELDVSATPVVELGRKRPRDTDLQLRNQLGRFGFSQTRADTQVSNLSGGEKARLLFALMTCEKPHILLLDEPSNHLDVDSREALVQALNAFEGAVVIVSHDPHLVEMTADRFWLVRDGRVGPYDGDMADYRALLLGGSNGKSERRTKGVNKKEQRRLAAEQRQAASQVKKGLNAAEKAVERLTKEQAQHVNDLANPALYEGDSGDLVALRKKLGKVERKLADAEELWAELQEKWDQESETP